jgi:hypothetical protein
MGTGDAIGIASSSQRISWNVSIINILVLLCHGYNPDLKRSSLAAGSFLPIQSAAYACPCTWQSID